MIRIVIATDNQGKIQELTPFLGSLDIQFIPQGTLGISTPEETGLTFIENAILKARYASKMSNLPSLADDSGICVKALQGAPGLYSARFAGPQATAKDNYTKLLKALDDTGTQDRTALFYCAIAFVRHKTDTTPLIAIGETHGSIALKPTGQGGFGYDPVFYVPRFKATVAELLIEQKNEVSHRSIAIRSMCEQLKALYA